MSTFDVAAASRELDERFASWIKDLGLVFEAVAPGFVRMRLPFNARLTRFGGMVCGQALMAVADTSMVFAVAARIGQFQDMATVGQNTSFFRAASGVDLICETRVLKFGRTLCFGEATLAGVDRPGDPVAQATMTYALAGPR